MNTIKENGFSVNVVTSDYNSYVGPYRCSFIVCRSVNSKVWVSSSSFVCVFSQPKENNLNSEYFFHSLVPKRANKNEVNFMLMMATKINQANYVIGRTTLTKSKMSMF